MSLQVLSETRATKHPAALRRLYEKELSIKMGLGLNLVIILPNANSQKRSNAWKF